MYKVICKDKKKKQQSHLLSSFFLILCVKNIFLSIFLSNKKVNIKKQHYLFGEMMKSNYLCTKFNFLCNNEKNTKF